MPKRFAEVGDFRIPALASSDVLWLQLGLAVATLLRAGDYASSGNDPSAVLDGVLPMGAWALWALLCGGLLLYGLAASCHKMIAWAHGLSTVLFVGITSSYLFWTLATWPPIEAVVRLNISSAPWVGLILLLVLAVLAASHRVRQRSKKFWYAPAITVVACAAFMVFTHSLPADGIRTAASVAVQGWLHCLLFIRMGWEPLDEKHAHETEGVLEAK